MITREFISKKYGAVICLFDDKDENLLNSHSWRVSFNKEGKPLCVVRNADGKTLSFHREKLEALKGTEIDHKNRNPLDNRLENLRFCTRSENVRNRASYSAKTKFKGIEQNKSKTLWRVAFTFDSIIFTSPAIFSEVEAAERYDKIAKLLYGEFVVLNFPEENK